MSEQIMIEGRCLCGAAHWTFDRVPESATLCNCTACRRYGALWAYDYEGEAIHVTGKLSSFIRSDLDDTWLSFDFCPTCGCLVRWFGLKRDEEDGNRRRVAINLRLAEPDAVSAIPVKRFNGLEWKENDATAEHCVADFWP